MIDNDLLKSAQSDSPLRRNSPLVYVLITPARNEGAFIELTVKSMVSQSVPPAKWIIVSDGSTDNTDEIIQRYAAEFPWIELVRMPERKERHFAGKVHAFNAGFEKLSGINYDIVGNLDGDVSFDEGYFEFLLKKFAESPRLGVAGTPFREGTYQYDYRFTTAEHVSGQCQLFRRECFEEIGRYVPRKMGGIDLVAVITARMKGWQTRSFLEKTYIHHRVMGTASHHRLMVDFNGGRGDFVLGSHPVWEFVRCIYQMGRRPIVLGGVFRLVGFILAMVSRAEKQVSPELVRFRRKEQMHRLREFLKTVLTLGLSKREYADHSGGS